MAYETTNVPVAKSQEELRKVLRRYGADRFSFTESRELAEVTFSHGAWAVRMRVPIRPMTEAAAREWARAQRVNQAKAVEGRQDSETRRVWRVLYWLLKTRMEAIDAGVETFEQAFLPHLLDEQSDRTVYEAMTDSGALKQLESGGA